MTAEEIAAPLRAAYWRAKKVLALAEARPAADLNAEIVLRELVEAFEQSEHCLKILVMREKA